MVFGKYLICDSPKAYSGSDKIVFLEQDVFTVEVPIPDTANMESDSNAVKNGGLNGGLNDGLNEDINEDINGDINGDINAVLILIKNNAGIKAKNIANRVIKPKKTIDRYLKKLKDIGKIEYRGSNKTGGYYAI